MILGECTSTQRLRAELGRAGNGSNSPVQRKYDWMEKKTIFPFSALDEEQLCHKKSSVWEPGDWRFQWIVLFLLLICIWLFSSAVFFLRTGVAFQYLEEVVEGWGASSVKSRRTVQSEWISCCPLGNASRSLSRGKELSCTFHQLWWSCQKGIWRSFAPAAPGSWQGAELHHRVPPLCLKAVAGKRCVHDSTVPELSLAHRVETLAGTPLDIRHSWHHAGILYGC